MGSFQKNKRTKISGPKKGKKAQKTYNSDLSYEISVLEGILGPNKIFCQENKILVGFWGEFWAKCFKQHQNQLKIDKGMCS